MPRYLIERTVGTITKDELDAVARKSIEVLREMPGVTWIKSYVSERDGKVFCEYEAPDVESIHEHARKAGLPVDGVREISLSISPEMFV